MHAAEGGRGRKAIEVRLGGGRGERRVQRLEEKVGGRPEEREKREVNRMQRDSSRYVGRGST